MKYIYSIKDIDNKTAAYFVTSKWPLTYEEQRLLETCLEDVKQEYADNGRVAETIDMIYDALDEFKDKTGKILQVDNNAIDGYLTF